MLQPIPAAPIVGDHFQTDGERMAGNLATTRRTAPLAVISLALGLMTLFGLPAGLLIWLAGPGPSTAVLLTATGVQLLMAMGAVALGWMSKPAGVSGRRPTSAWAGIVLGGLSLALITVLAAVLTFNNVSKSMNRSVAETDANILQLD